MEDFNPFGSRIYALMFLLLVVGRGMDFLSTWVATPNLVLEGNPIAKKLGWRWGIPLNGVLCVVLAYWSFPAIVVATTSLLVAARNFQSAWLMRSLGEQAYRDWHIERIQETRVTLFLFCLAGNTLPTAAVGAALYYFGDNNLVPAAVGVGVIGYAAAVGFFTLLAVWRLRQGAIAQARQREANAVLERAAARTAKNDGFGPLGDSAQWQGK